MTTLAWIVGRGGLLGKGLVRALSQGLPAARLFEPSVGPIQWHAPEAAATQLALAAGHFAAAVKEGAHDSWTVLWAAGAGVVGTTAAELQKETVTLSRFLHSVEASDLCARPGRFFLASSAGGVYGGARVLPITEQTATAPISDYGLAKLAQEQLVVNWSQRHEGVRALIGRVSNVYGPGQRLDKPQGFLSQICRSAVLRQPVHVFVPLDTIRDFIYVDDCAQSILSALRLTMAEQNAPRLRIKIFAREEAVSLGYVLSLHARILKRPAQVISARRPGSQAQQALGLKFRSIVLPTGLAPTGLMDGLARLMAHLELLHQQGRLRRKPDRSCSI